MKGYRSTKTPIVFIKLNRYWDLLIFEEENGHKSVDVWSRRTVLLKPLFETNPKRRIK